jgi:adenine deaminase
VSSVFQLSLCCDGRYTSFPQSARWKSVFASTMHPQNRLPDFSAVDTRLLDIGVEKISRLAGGLVACANLEVPASLPLPIGGLLSLEPLDVVVLQHETAERAAASPGHLPPSPFAILSFLGLPVIPELRPTDFGLADVNEFKLLK